MRIYDVERTDLEFPRACAPVRTVVFPGAGAGPADCLFALLPAGADGAEDGAEGAASVLVCGARASLVPLAHKSNAAYNHPAGRPSPPRAPRRRRPRRTAGCPPRRGSAR